MKKLLSLILVFIILFSALPMTVFAVEADKYADTGVEFDLADVACLDKELPHGDTIWADITALEQDRLPENAQPEDYSALFDEVEAIVTSSDEYVDGSLVCEGSAIYWDTPDGMAHGWSPCLRAEVNSRSDTDGLTVANGDTDTIPLSSDDDSSLCQREPSELAPTGADSNLAEVAANSSTAKNIALFAPYYNYSGDNWGNDTALLADLASVTGGSYKTYNNSNASIDAIADALESCAVILMYTHGNVDRNGAMYDTRMSNTSYLTLTSGTGISSDDTKWVIGNYGRYRHAFNGGTSTQADSNTVYYVDGTAIANHMDQQAPNNLLWMDSCMTMATDGLCKPLMNKGVGVVLGYSKPVSAYGGGLYCDYFFESLLTGATVSTAARYMKQQAGCDWDPVFKQVDYSIAISTGVAFPVFAADNTPYPGQYSVNGTQTVISSWCLPSKNPTSFVKRSVLNVDLLQRIDCTFPFAPDFTDVRLLSGSLPAGMNLFWSKDELYFRGTPTAVGARSATYQLTCGGSSYTLQVDIAVVKNQNTDKTYSYSFTSGDIFSTDINPGSDYFSCTRISGEIPPMMTAKLADRGLHIETETRIDPNTGKTVAYPILAGTYTSLYDIVTKNGVRYHCTINILVSPKTTSTVQSKTVTMAKGLKGIISLGRIGSFRIEVVSGSLPDGVRPAYSYDRGLCIIGTPTATGKYTVSFKLYNCQGDCRKMDLTVNVNEPSVTDCTVNLYSITGSKLSNETRKGSSTYTLPEYTATLPNGIRFTEWWYDGKTYKAGSTITINALTADIYALCAENGMIDSVSVSTDAKPQAGSAITYHANVPTHALYAVSDNTTGSWQNGVLWYKGSKILSPANPGVFEQGATYTICVMIKPNEGYVFADYYELAATVNGSAAEKVTDYGESGYCVIYTFTVPEVIQIDQIDITIPEPKVGDIIKYEAETPDGAGYHVADYNNGTYESGVMWEDNYGAYSPQSDNYFTEGDDYTVRLLVDITDPDLNEFMPSMSMEGYVNGRRADLDRISDTRYRVSYTFNVQDLVPVILGDVDGDGEITIIDATYIQRKLAWLDNRKPFIEKASDTDGNGELSILDATYIQRWLASLPSNNKIGKPVT